MKFLAILLIVAVASAKPRAGELSEVQQIIAAIQSPSTDPATAAALEQMLQDIVGSFEPIAVGPAIVAPVDPVIVVDQPSPIGVGPAIIAPVDPVIVVDQPSPVAVGPAIIAPVDPVIVVDQPAAVVEPSPVALPESVDSTPIVEATPIAPASAPLVQIILNINQAESAAPVVIPPAGADSPIEAPVAVDPVNVVDQAPIDPSPVIVAPVPVDPVIVAPVPVDPVIVAPGPVAPVEPVLVGTPIIPEPVIVPEPVVVGTPVIPTPVITLPETLN